MSLTTSGTWQAGVWNATVWAQCVWSEPSCEQRGGTSRRRKRRTIRLSELDERERQEALADVPVRAFTALEQAAFDLGEADEDEQEEDEIILMALMRIYH